MTLSNLRSSSGSKGAHSKRIVGGCFEARVKNGGHRGWRGGGERVGGGGRVDRLPSHLAWVPGGKGGRRGKASRNSSRSLKTGVFKQVYKFRVYKIYSMNIKFH